MNDPVEYEPIGLIRTPFDDPEGMPIQARAADAAGRLELAERFEAGLADLEGFSHVVLLYHFHRSESATLTVTPFLDGTQRGVFATRAPARPNSIGLSVVRLAGVEATTVAVEGVDVVDRTPLLDIKPFVPEFDVPTDAAAGWLEGREADGVSADDRFAGGEPVDR